MRRETLKLFSLPLMIAGAALALCVSTVSAQDVDVEQEQSLYDRLGGVYAIATVVDDFIERLYVNDVLNANPMIKEARDSVPKAGIKYRLTSLVCQLAGGPEVYNGRSMKEAHKHLNISEKEWDEMVRVFVETLTDFKVPEKEQSELLALVAPTKGDIVTAK